MIEAVSEEANGSQQDPAEELHVELLVRDTTGPASQEAV
jgi:hypothetical protein